MTAMPKEKDTKTNALRLLETAGVAYEAIHYECKEFTDGVHAADAAGTPPDQTYKTLVGTGKSGQHYVLVLPVAGEVDLKKAARAAGEKALELISVKELLPLTGYVRGGVSPLAMKKAFPTLGQEEAQLYDEIFVSGGRIGLSVKLAPDELLRVTGGSYADFCK